MRFGAWEILERLEIPGGGFDALATDENGREVRLWVGASGSAAAHEAADGLRKKLATIYHASLPTVLGASTVDDRAVLIFKPYHGRMLSQSLSEGPLAATEAIDLVRSVGAALVKAHRADVVHGAVGPDEILRSDDGRTLLLHLGWGPFLGARPARAPEDLAQPGGSEGGDVFGLARVLLQCLEGRDPIGDGDAALATFPSRAPRDPSTFPSELPEGLRRLLARAIHPDASKRMRRAEELAGDLGVIRASWDTLGRELPRPTFPFPPLLHPAVLAGAALVAVALLLLALRGCGAEKPG
jgi:serine/threonine protein kinase